MPGIETRLRAYLQLGRVSNLPTVLTNILAGASLAGALPSIGALLPAWIAVGLFYLAGMFLNDAFDVEFDREHRPERPIPSGKVSQREVIIAGLSLLVAGGVIAVLWSGQQGGSEAGTAGTATALIVAILYYDYFHKSISYGPLIMALCRTLVYLMAALIFTATLELEPVIGGILLFVYMTGLTALARREHLDDTGGGHAVALLLAPLLVLVYSFSAPALLVAAPFLVWTLYSAGIFLRGRSDSRQRGIAHLLAGICLLDALMMASAGAPLGYVAFALAAFLVTLFLHRLVAGT